MSTTRRGFILKAAAGAGAVLTRGLPGFAKKKRKRHRPEPDWLFADAFKRVDRSGWGRVWFNQRYGRHWQVRDGKGIFRLPPIEGQIAEPKDYRPNPLLVLDHDVANIDLKATLSVSNATARIGLLARAVNYADYYTVYLDPDGHLRAIRCGSHNEKRLGRTPFVFLPNVAYRMRMRVTGDGPVRLRAKVWAAAAPEPAGWMLDVQDATKKLIPSRGSFGIFTAHGIDRLGASFRVRDVIAHSVEKGRPTPPTIAYSYAGLLLNAARSVKVVAKTAIPARVGFIYGPEPTLSHGTQVIPPQPTVGGAETTKATLDLAGLPPSSTVYWRAFAVRRGVVVQGETASVRTPPPSGFPIRFAFAACTRWAPFPKTSFDQIRLKLPEFVLHQGDLGYVNKLVIRQARDTYQDHWVRILMDPSVAALQRSGPLGFFPDDHDYGENAADRHSYKRFTVPAHNQLHPNPRRPYFSFRTGDVFTFVLDCRRYSTGIKPPVEKRSKLGAEQMAWLKTSMQEAADTLNPGLLVVASPMAFGSDVSPESWRRRYTTEWSELMDFFQSLEAPVLIVSGDQHGQKLHEYPQKNLQVDVPRVVEFVSAGTEPKTKWAEGVDPETILRQSKRPGFGLVELGQEELVGRQRVRSLSLTAVNTADGSPLWTANYTIVRGLGILPAV